MLLSKPLHQTPVTYFGSQIPPTMKNALNNFVASYLFAYIILALMILFTIFSVTESSINLDLLGSTQPTHQCVDTSHSSCDGTCECDGMECN